MPRLAIVSDAIHPFNKGGKEKRIYELSKRLSKMGWDVHIYTMNWWQGSPVTTFEDLTLHAICPLYPLYSGERRSIKEGILFGLATFKLIKDDFDILEVDSMPYFPLFSAKIVSILKRKKLIGVWHEVWSKEYWMKYLGVKGFLGYTVEKLSANLPDKIISASEMTKERLMSLYQHPFESTLITNGIDIKEISNVKPSEIKIDVLFAGRLLAHKNVDVLLRAFSIVLQAKPNLRLLIVGEGPERKRLEELSHKLELTKNVSFSDFFEKTSDLYAKMKSSKLFVLPSSREGFGLTVIEANACSIPVLTINDSENAAKSLITNYENGLVTMLSDKAIAEGIIEILSWNSKPTLKEKCFDTAKKYDWNTQAELLNQIYTPLIN